VSEPTYTISADGKSITCNLCGKTSYNLTDVREKFCARCKVFHDDLEAIERLRVKIRELINPRVEDATRL
jgi:uncharacterized protein (UPF0179 family)